VAVLGLFSAPAREEAPDVPMKHASAAPDGTAPAPATPVPSRVGILGRALVLLGAAFAFIPLGLFYLPMAILANVVMGSPWACLNAPFVIRSMFAAPKDYAICVALYFGVFFISGGGEVVAALLGIIPTGLALGFVELYCMTVLMRMMGQFYRMNQARLAWLGD
jgi:hypothetical protein